MTYRFSPLAWLCLLPLLWGNSLMVCAADTSSASKPDFGRDASALLQRYCVRCHGGDKPKAELALDRLTSEAEARKHPQMWEAILKNIRSGAMPPSGRRAPKPTEVAALERYVDTVIFRVDCKLRDPGQVTIRRLNRAEYNNTIRDLVGVDFKPAKDFPADDVGYGFDNIGDVLSMPPVLMEKYLAAADTIIEEAFRSPRSRKKIVIRPLKDRGAVWHSLRHFASRAYRRPVADDEMRRLIRLVKLARERGDSTETGVKLACKAILVSPHFLFRIEKDAPAKGGVRQLNDWELASRLSYFLWSSMPDEELFALARKNQLRKPGILKKQVQRMLRDPKSRSLVDNFASQWLQLRDLKEFHPDPRGYPTFNAELRQAMAEETERFFLSIVREDRSILDFLDAQYTFVNERLAKHYGIAGVKGSEFRRVSLKDTPRGGILTHASILAVTSNPTRTSPVKRGKWILENLLGTPPPPPPPNVPELEEGKGPTTGTLRQQMEKHRTNPVCASCHARMDPLGFALENFDAIGAWRTHEGKHRIDVSGELPGGPKFNGPVELRDVLKKKQNDFARCFTEKMLTYALGRGLERTDSCYVKDITRDLEKHGYRFSSLVLGIVQSDPFQKRKTKRGSR